jgi:hypothetical protein
MKDEDVEALLGRYRPLARVPPLAAGPPSPGLRHASPPRTWPWAAAAAALLAITIGLHAAAAPAPEDPPDPVRVEALTAQLGGTPAARALAEAIVRADAARTVDRDQLSSRIGGTK